MGKIKILGYEIKKSVQSVAIGNMLSQQLQFINSSVDEQMSLNFAIASCFNEISRSFKSLQFGVYKNEKGDYKKSNSMVAKRLDKMIKEPNHLCNWQQIIESYLSSIYFNGNCLMRKIPSVTGLGKDDFYIYMNNNYIIEREKNTLAIKRIVIGGDIFEGDDIENFKIVTEFNPLSVLAGTRNGTARAEQLQPIKRLINATIAYNESVVKNGGSLGGVLGVEQPMPEKSFKEFTKSFIDKFTGSGNAGRPLVANSKINYTPMGTAPKDLDYVESIKEMQKIVCRLMGVPETLIIGENSSYNNSLEFKKKMYTELVIPLAEEFCQHLTFLFRKELADNEEFYMSTSNIKCLQSSMTLEIQQLVASLSGICTINNVIRVINDKYQLELEELGKDGEVVLVASNMMTLNDVIGSGGMDLSLGSNDEL